MADDQYFRPRNWQKFQRYKRKRPPWIRLHTQLLHDYDFLRLAPTHQLHLIKIWLLYAQLGRPLAWDCDWLAGPLGGLSKHIGRSLNTLERSNFIEICEKREQKEPPETDNSEGSPRSTETDTTSAPPETAKVVPLKRNQEENKNIPEQMIQIWNEIVRSPPVKALNDTRRRNLLARFNNELGRDLGAWRIYCQRIKENEFLQGGGERGWRANLDWAIKTQSLLKTMEGNYGQDRDEAASDLRDSINRAFDDDDRDEPDP